MWGRCLENKCLWLLTCPEYDGFLIARRINLNMPTCSKARLQNFEHFLLLNRFLTLSMNENCDLPQENVQQGLTVQTGQSKREMNGKQML